MKLKICLLSLACTFSFALFGQFNCNNPENHLIKERLLENKELAKNAVYSRVDRTYYVRVHYTIIQKNDGSGENVQLTDILDMHCALNEVYANTGIQFVLRGTNQLNYLRSTFAYNDPRGNIGRAAIRGAKKNDAMNVFIGMNLNGNNEGTTLGFFSPTDDFVILLQKEVNNRSATLPHEVGHFFSLLHTFHGSETYVDGCASLPFEFFSRTKMHNGQVNCEVLGDTFCDTPADYNTQFGEGWGCQYRGNEQDQDCENLEPMVSNYMGYYEGCPDYEFTDQQITAMYNDISLNSKRAAYRNDDIYEWKDVVSNNISSRFPENGQELDFYGNVILRWEPVENAEAYLVDITPRIDGLGRLGQWITKEAQFDASGLFSADKKYYYRVRPYDRYNTCADYSDFFEFTTGDAEIKNFDINNDLDVAITPNPATNFINVIMNDNLVITSGVKISVFDIHGNYVHESMTHESDLRINISDLSNGLYFVVGQSENKNFVRQIVKI